VPPCVLLTVKSGNGSKTLNVAAPLLVPPVVVTVTLRGPRVALDATANVAVICVVLTTFVLLSVTPAPLMAMVVAPKTNIDPFSVTSTEFPTTPKLGLMPDRIGTPGNTVNVTGLLVPLPVVTVTLRAPT